MPTSFDLSQAKLATIKTAEGWEPGVFVPISTLNDADYVELPSPASGPELRSRLYLPTEGGRSILAQSMGLLGRDGTIRSSSITAMVPYSSTGNAPTSYCSRMEAKFDTLILKCKSAFAALSDETWRSVAKES